jgi:hypothetical protein
MSNETDEPHDDMLQNGSEENENGRRECEEESTDCEYGDSGTVW